MENEFSFLSLLLITALAVFVPLLSSRLKKLRVPIVVGEIIAGMIIGKSGFNLIEPSPALSFLTLFGFTYLMFLSGLEVDFEIISGNSTNGERRRFFENPVKLGLVVFALTIGIAFAAAEVLLQFGLVQEPFIIALILSTTSLGIVVPVLKERGIMASRYGQSLLMSALVADFGTLVLIAIDVAIISQGLTLEVLLVFILLAAFAVAVQAGKLAARIPGLPRVIEELSHATSQIRVRGAMALMIAFIVLSEWLGSEIILGAFLAGAVISLLSPREGSQLQVKIEAIGFGFFIPIFFIMVGVQFDLPALMESREALILVPILLIIAYAIKFASGLLYRTIFSWRETFAAGSLLSSRLSLIIAAAAIAFELGIIDEAVDSAIILVAIVTSVLSPLLFNRIYKSQVPITRHGVILVGLGEMPILLAKRLLQADTPVIIVGENRGRNRGERRQNLPVLEGDPTDPDVLAEAGAPTAKALVAASSFDDINLQACRLAVEEFNIPNLVASATDPDIAKEMLKLGVRVIRPQLATLLALEGALQFPAAFDMLTDHTDGVDVREVELNNPLYNDQLLRRIRLPGDALVLGLRRNGEVLVPHGNTRLRQGDVLMLVGHHEALIKSLNQLNSTSS